MANDAFEINVSGLGSASGKGGNLDVSGIQKAINSVASDLKKLDLSSFQRSLTDLTKNIQKAATSAGNYVSNMQKSEARLSSSLKEGFRVRSVKADGTPLTYEAIDPKAWSKKALGGEAYTSEKFVKSIASLSDSIEKLASGIKEGFKGNGEDKKNKKGKEGDFVADAKKLLAAVGVQAVFKQLTENELIAPARASGLLINSNVVSNPRQAGNELLSSYQNRVSSDTGILTGVGGAIAGALAGSIIPGVGTIAGAIGGYIGGSSFGNNLGKEKLATELPTLQRSINYEYYSSLSKQIPGYSQFAEAQYGSKGFSATEAFQDPYFESKAELGKSFSRFGGGNLSASTTSNILKSLTAQGATSPQELNITGNLLGQIARYTGKSSIDLEKVYTAVQNSGISPNEGLQKSLSLLQNGLSVKQTEAILQKGSQRTEGFSAAQNSYFGSSPFQQFSAQLVGKAVGIDVEKLEQGDRGEAAKLRNIFEGSNKELRAGKLGINSIKRQQLLAVGIGNDLADSGAINLKTGARKGFIEQNRFQNKLIAETKDSIIKGQNGRGPEQIVEEALTEIGNSAKSFTALGTATDNLTGTFSKAIDTISLYLSQIAPTSIPGITFSTATPKAPR